MDYRNERDALRGRVESLEQQLDEAQGAAREPQATQGSQVEAARLAQLQAAGANRYGQAESSLKSAGIRLKVEQVGLAGLGALLVVAGLVMVFMVGVTKGSAMVVTGVLLGWWAWFMLPKFTGPLGSAAAMVGALHAKEQLAMTGTPMTARVLSVQQTGTTINMNPQIHAFLEVQGPQGPYQVQTMAVIPQMNIPHCQPGAMVHVRVNPLNPQDVAVVF